jgi:hypothetical protein
MSDLASRKSARKVSAPKVTDEMRSLAASAWAHARAESAARSAREKAENTLFGLMEAAKVGRFPVTIEGETPLVVDATIEARERQVVDPRKLEELVDDETFLAIVTASQKAVTDHAGALIARECLVAETGPRKLYLKPRKG